MLTLILICALGLIDSKTIAVQIALDRRGYSSNTIDGQWGRKSQSALTAYCRETGHALPVSPEAAYDELFSEDAPPFTEDTVTSEELAALVQIPKSPEGKSALPRLGYASIREMYAERGHVSEHTLTRLNPTLDWRHITVGTTITLPDLPAPATDLSATKHAHPAAPRPHEATLIRISLSRFEIAAYNSSGRLLALMPCSIAKDKAKVPQGELKIVTLVPNPNYTYTPDFIPKGKKTSRYILPAGPNNPVGIAWIGLNLPGFGIHGTPTPETIGRAESHGCFRLANWNAARLYAMARIGTRVIVEP